MNASGCATGTFVNGPVPESTVAGLLVASVVEQVVD
jgi:hypothetical protein